MMLHSSKPAVCGRGVAIALAVAASSIAAADGLAPAITFSQQPDGVTVLIGDQLFTRYLTSSGTRPVLWPVVGPTSAEMTRAYPVSTKRAGEATDHIHHRSIWIGYEGLGGVDFWHEPATRYDGPFEVGEVIHRGFRLIESQGETGTLVTENRLARQ